MVYDIKSSWPSATSPLFVEEEFGEVERVLAYEAIKNLKARYFRTIDTKDWTGLQAVFTEDAVFDCRGGLEETPENPVYDDEPLVGADIIVAFVAGFLASITSVHHGHMPEIELLSADHARAIWPMNDILRPSGGEPFHILRGSGHYYETYTRKDGEWRIATLRLTRILVEKI